MQSLIIGILIGLVVGGAIAWALWSGRAKAAEALASEREGRLAAREEELGRALEELSSERQKSARIEEANKNLEEHKKFLEDAEKRLREAFQSLSLDALAKNAEQVVSMAQEKFDGKKELIDQSLDAMSKTLADVQKKLSDVEKGSVEVSTVIRHHTEVTTKLKDTADHLRHALASSKKRGEWGERMAEDIIRLAGMAEGINYIKQKTLDDSPGRPDYTFLLPNGLKINMDVKFPLDNYQHYLDAQSEHDKKRFKEELIRNARAMIKQVAGRSYIDPANSTVDYAIMFVPNEQVYGFINESDLKLMDDALGQKVIVCSPFTLYAVLAVIRQAVENFNLERTASEILKLLVEFSKQWNKYKDTFAVLGERLDAARKEYDALLTTRVNMLERPLKKIEEMRKHKAIPLESEMGLDDSLPL